jgi:hypothetical protein
MPEKKPKRSKDEKQGARQLMKLLGVKYTVALREYQKRQAELTQSQE